MVEKLCFVKRKSYPRSSRSAFASLVLAVAVVGAVVPPTGQAATAPSLFPDCIIMVIGGVTSL